MIKKKPSQKRGRRFSLGYMGILGGLCFGSLTLLTSESSEAARQCTSDTFGAGSGKTCKYDDYASLIGKSESGNQAGICNSYGYCGTYQMGEAYLMSAGCVSGDGNPNDNSRGNYQFTGVASENGVKTMDDFLKNQAAQDACFKKGQANNWSSIQKLGLDSYVGKTGPNGETITESGLLAAAHLGGVGSVKKYLNGQGNRADANGTKVSDYMSCFGGCETPFGSEALSSPGETGGSECGVDDSQPNAYTNEQSERSKGWEDSIKSQSGGMLKRLGIPSTTKVFDF